MIAELIYTSAPKTLDGPGYGVVAKSQGIPERLEKLMRQLSRYDFDPTPTSDADGISRAVFSHATLQDNSGTWHIMSRVGFGGYDFTQRAVFLAHHVAVTADELRNVPPAVLMHDRSLFQTRWEGEAELIPARPLPAASGRRHADAWARIGGKGNWRNAWIDLWGRTAGQATFLIVPDGADVLALFADASLDPSIDSQELSFITALNADRAGIQFDWVGLPAGGDFTRSVLRACPDRTLDLTGPFPTVPEKPIPKPEPAAPKRKQATTAIAPHSVAPAADDQAFHELWKDDAMRVVQSRMSRPQPARPKMLPPLPPPDSFIIRNAKPMAIIGTFALATVLCGAFVVTLLKPPARPNSGQPGPGSQPANWAADSAKPSDVPKRDTIAAKPPGPVPTKGAAPPAPRESSPPQAGKRLTANPKPPKVYHLQGWLPAIAVQHSPDGWHLLLDLPIVEPASLRLLSPQELGLRTLTGRDGLEIRVANGQVASGRADGSNPVGGAGRTDSTKGKDELVIARVNGGKLQVRLPADPEGDILNRLQLSVLEVSSKQQQLNGEPVARVLFTPRLSAVPFSSSSPSFWEDKIESNLLEGAKQFFIDTDKLQKQFHVHLRVRIASVSLSILPGENPGWLVPSPLESPLEQELRQFLKSGSDGDQWSAVVSLKTYFDREEAKGHSAIEAKLAVTEPAFKSGAEAHASESQNRSPVNGTKRGKSENAGRTEPTKDKPAPQTAAKSPSGQKGPKTSPEMPASSSRSEPAPGGTPPAKLGTTSSEPKKDSGHAEFLSDLFRRYGRVHGAVIVSAIDSRSSNKVDIEILRFGGVPTR